MQRCTLQTERLDEIEIAVLANELHAAAVAAAKDVVALRIRLARWNLQRIDNAHRVDLQFSDHLNESLHGHSELRNAPREFALWDEPTGQK